MSWADIVFGAKPSAWLPILASAILGLALLAPASAQAQVTSCGGQPNGTPCWQADGGCWTVGLCQLGLTCVGSFQLPAGTPCDDGAFCNGAETCDGAGACVSPGDPCPGPDGDGDCSESCNEATDSCTAVDPDGAICDPGGECTNAGTCGGGDCAFLFDPNKLAGSI